MKKIFSFIISLSALLTLLSCEQKPQTGATDKPMVKIGVSLPITGGAAYVGQPAAYAAQMALDKWNEKNTKFNYRLIIEDDQLSVKGIAAAGNKLVNIDKVNGVVSMWGFAAPIYMDLSKKADIPHITCSWGDSFFDGINTFNSTTPPDKLAEKMVKLLQMKKVKTVGFVTQQAPGDGEMKAHFSQELKKNNIEIAWEETFNIGNKDFKMFFSKINNKPVDMMIITMVPEDFYAFLKQKKEAGNPFDFTTVDYFTSMDKNLVDGRFYIRSSIGTKEFEERLNQKTQAHLGDCLGNIYDNVDLLINAFENAKDSDKELPTTAEIVAYLKTLQDYPGVIGNLTVKANGQIDSPAHIVKIQNGVPVVID